jgi:hypothetical protein
MIQQQEQDKSLSFNNLLKYQQLYVLAAVLLFISTVLFIRSTNPYERLSIVFVMIVIVWYGSRNASLIGKDVTVEDKTIEAVLNTVSELDLTIAAPVLYILNSDKQLLKALYRLTQFIEYDVDVVRKVVVHIVRFYETYADVMTGNNIEKYDHLVDIRSDLLQTLSSIPITITYPRHVELIEAITLVIKSATYKALNVVRNKYHKSKLNTFSLKPPYPTNLYKKNTDAFEIVYSNS